MKVVFTNRPKNIFSILIRLITRKRGQKLEEIPSHVSLLFYDTMVLEAVMLKGVILNYLPTFLKPNNVLAVYELKAKERDWWFYKKAADKYHGQGYDWRGLFWFVWVFVLYQVFGREVPKLNTSENKNKAFCNEILSIIINENTSHIDPNSMMLSLESDSRFTKVGNEKNKAVLF